jgi:hypothetical protein
VEVSLYTPFQPFPFPFLNNLMTSPPPPNPISPRHMVKDTDITKLINIPVVDLVRIGMDQILEEEEEVVVVVEEDMVRRFQEMSFSWD